jgi:RNase P/RNase MRP subunit POP5
VWPYIIFPVLYFHKDTKLGVLRSTREHIKLVETCLAIITEYQGSEIRIRVARVCGSSRTCRVKLYDLSMEKLKHALSSIEWETYIQKLREEIALIDPQWA